MAGGGGGGGTGLSSLILPGGGGYQSLNAMNPIASLDSDPCARTNTTENSLLQLFDYFYCTNTKNKDSQFMTTALVKETGEN